MKILRDGTYHRDIYIPDTPAWAGEFRLAYSDHALLEAVRDRYFQGCNCRLPAGIKLTANDPDRVEVTFENGLCVKQVIRVHFTEWLDLILVVVPFGYGALKVKTVWFNRRTDKHATLDRSRYVPRSMAELADRLGNHRPDGCLTIKPV